MSLQVKDGNGAAHTLKTAVDAGEHVPHHKAEQSGSWSVLITGAGALADAAANPTTSIVGAGVMFYNGATWDRARGDTTNGLDVDVTRVLPGTTATSLGKAEDAAAGDGDIGVAMLAVRRNTASSGVGSDGDYANLCVDANGKLWTSPSDAGVDAVNVQPDVSTLRNGAVALTPKFAVISANNDGDTIVPLVASKKIRVLDFCATANEDNAITFQSNATAKTGAMQIGTNGPDRIVSGFSPVGHFETAAGEALKIGMTSNKQISGWVVYVEV